MIGWTQRTSDYSWHTVDEFGTQYVVSKTYNADGTVQWVGAWVMEGGDLRIAPAAWETAAEAKDYMEGVM